MNRKQRPQGSQSHREYTMSNNEQNYYQEGNNNNNPNQDAYLNPFGNVNPDALRYGLGVGKNLLKDQASKYVPGLSSFWLDLKGYFMVSGSFVTKKLTIVLFPFNIIDWSRKGFDESIDENYTSHKNAPPKADVNAPDLYIPLMAFITYILLVGYAKGTSNTFTPDVLIRAIWSCLAMQVVEVLVCKFATNTLTPSLPFLDLFALTGYKYVGLCVNTLFLLFGGVLYFLCSLFTAAAHGFFILKSFAVAVPQNVNSNVPPRHLVLLCLALMEFVVVCLWSWL